LTGFSWDISLLHETKPQILTVPVPAERGGDFTADPSLAEVCTAGVTNCLYEQNGGCTIYCNNFFGDAGSSLTTHNLSTKIDHAISDKHKLFGEWLFNPSYYANFRYPWYGPK
jgi:hypothetical protein